jgi:hypothetical protein
VLQAGPTPLRSYGVTVYRVCALADLDVPGCFPGKCPQAETECLSKDRKHTRKSPGAGNPFATNTSAFESPGKNT